MRADLPAAMAANGSAYPLGLGCFFSGYNLVHGLLRTGSEFRNDCDFLMRPILDAGASESIHHVPDSGLLMYGFCYPPKV